MAGRSDGGDIDKVIAKLVISGRPWQQNAWSLIMRKRTRMSLVYQFLRYVQRVRFKERVMKRG